MHEGSPAGFDDRALLIVGAGIPDGVHIDYLGPQDPLRHADGPVPRTSQRQALEPHIVGRYLNHGTEAGIGGRSNTAYNALVTFVLLHALEEYFLVKFESWLCMKLVDGEGAQEDVWPGPKSPD